ncbi:MAG TPA: wax ester/triacylglycerol synthase family O-acyltransferase [Piscinibacter sp.]|jgi:diacylglycerol O-acyltransferase|uniref:wax ester/triacylglycerol synthase family O-acyltransferase n=1 Tax=Piscinibacter sp. TaxID=1903157 RepID=UPI001D626EFF|nr:wax ester/triacylglycerol synthase family O-acyltransferase [Piscinibacter sp.]MBK7529925.1 wax ester/triacylglycerol synthase family O-acyltransferase [Piscinibacter sp.]HOY35650.1 wax ester/triacylglycerol synthase family O-acyltransferase [Piscinibacter sp.]HPG79002.1 wax ester/triacylglycerol synthase family O-acyltransferase [Piscinibacter sp.]HPM68537.1 wax ester/triacylglycerol synthase family O-acyltransferase [Piscinibacter sp.]
MKQLSGLDASFLYLETAEMPMHVGALHQFELPASYRGDFLADMRAHMATRIPLAPALRRKLAWMPLNLAAPVWVDAEPDLDEHIVGIALPAGSGLAELEEQVGELHPVLLDRSRPLWKFHVFDGLEPGPNGEKRYALYTQLHHAAVDGQAAVALAQAILDLGPEPREIAARPARERKGQLAMTEMLRGALSNQLDQLGNLVKALPAAVGAISQVAAQTAGGAVSETAASVWSRIKGAGPKGGKSVSNLGLAPRTRLNATVSDTRAFAAVSLPLAELNAVRRRHHASLNDAVLMICSSALRRHFAKHGPLPRKSLVAAVPISLRSKGDTASNNQASMSLISLGTHIADPGKRLAHVMAASASMKATLGSVKSLLPTDFPSMGVPWLMEGLTAIYGRAGVADRIPPVANVVISNVPGPTVPLYMAGAKMLTNYPTSIVVHGVALNITVQTYNDSLDVGIIACAQAMPEVDEFAAHVETSFLEFKGLPVAAEPVPAPPAPKVAAKKAAPKKAVAPKAPAKKAPAKKVAATKARLKKPAAKKVVAKKPAKPVPKVTPKARASAPTAKRPSR